MKKKMPFFLNHKKMESANIVIFGRETCPFCQRSKATAECLLEDGRIASFSFKTLGEKRETHKKQTAAHATVPQVFVNDEFIGGNSQFQEWTSKVFGAACRRGS